MNILKLTFLFCFVTQIYSCPTKLAKELLAKGKITLRDISNLEKYSLSLKSTGT